jgi:hypothetical protein
MTYQKNWSRLQILEVIHHAAAPLPFWWRRSRRDSSHRRWRRQTTSPAADRRSLQLWRRACPPTVLGVAAPSNEMRIRYIYIYVHTSQEARLRYEPNILMRSIGMTVPHRKHITSPLWAQLFNEIYRCLYLIGNTLPLRAKHANTIYRFVHISQEICYISANIPAS